MNRGQLAKTLSARTGLSREDADWLIRRFFETIARGLAEDGRVELRGLGVFKVNTRRQAGFHNPKNGVYYGGMTLKTVKFYPSVSTAPEA